MELSALATGFAMTVATAVTSVIIWYPFLYGRVRLAMDVSDKNKQLFKNFGDLSAKTYNEDGIRGSYRGSVVSLAGQVSYRLLYFGIFSNLIHLVGPHMFMKFVVAQIVVLSSCLLWYPFDTLQNRLIMQSLRNKKQYTNSLSGMKQIIKIEGIRGLFKGLSVHIMNKTLSALALVAVSQYKPKTL